MNRTIDISWPSTLPLPSIEYTGQPRYPLLISPKESIMLDRRSRFTTSYTDLAVTWMLSETEYDAFETFFSTTLNNGVAQFQIELKFPTLSALVAWAVRFLGDLSATYQDGYWQVQATIRLVNPIVIDVEEITLITEGGEELITEEGDVLILEELT
jgi:hypothetical protein